jgi:hypothetical protein
MVEMIRSLQDRTRALENNVRSVKTQQIWGKGIGVEARSIVDDYFRGMRAQLGALLGDNDSVARADSIMQSILESSHKNVSAANFRALLKKASVALHELEGIILYEGALHSPNAIEDHVDVQIVETLNRMLPSACLSYKQALIDLSESSRLSWRGPAADLRETLREVLDHLAPDADVTAQAGFRLEPNASGPTMKQKVRYVLSRRGYVRTAMDAPADAVTAVEAILGSFVRSVYTRSSVSTHTPSDKTEALRIRSFVRLALTELLEISE